MPDSEFLPAWEMNCAERAMRTSIERALPERHVTIGRVARLTRALGGRAACQARDQCFRGCR
jgi:hypothetical protein